MIVIDKQPRPTFAQGVVIALTLSIAGAALQALLVPWFAEGFVERLLIVLLSFSYFIWVSRGHRWGQLAAVTVWIGVALVIWLLADSSASFLFAHLALFSLSRMAFLKPGVTRCLFDIALVAAGVLVATWAATTTGSLVLTLWCFFLIQAVIGLRLGRSRAAPPAVDPFERSYRTAQAALKRLAESYQL